MRLLLFGHLRLLVRGEPYYIKNRKARELLALIAVNGGGPVKKLWAAETLWPDVEQAQAADSLYKVLRFWRQDSVLQSQFPLENRKSELALRAPSFFCDLWAFEEAAAGQDADRMQKAAELYTGPLLFQEYYEWTAEREAFCELRQLELLAALEAHFTAAGDRARAGYYRKKYELLQISD